MGYLAFGDDTQDIITFNLSPGWSTPAVKAALCAGLFLTFPPMMIPVYEIIERSLAKKVGSENPETRGAFSCFPYIIKYIIFHFDFSLSCTFEANLLYHWSSWTG